MQKKEVMINMILNLYLSDGTQGTYYSKSDVFNDAVKEIYEREWVSSNKTNEPTSVVFVRNIIKVEKGE